MKKKTHKPDSWQPWADHPYIVLILLIAGMVTIFAGIISIYTFYYVTPTPTPTPTPTAMPTLTPTPTATLTPTPPPVSDFTPTPTPIVDPTPIEEKDITFDVSSCAFSGDKINCKFTVKNTKPQIRTIYFYARRSNDEIRTRVFDNNGELDQFKLKLGDREIEEHFIKVSLPSDVPIRGEAIFFKNKETEKLEVIRLGFQLKNEGEPFQVDFRNVAIQ